MMITKQMIEQRLEALKKDMRALEQRANAVQGAILDCEFWLQQLDKKEEPDTNVVNMQRAGEAS